MPRDIVCIPTYYRPEFLHLCLESIFNADGGTCKEVWIAHDRHADDTRRTARSIGSISTDLRLTGEVVRNWGNRFRQVHYVVRDVHSYTGNCSNFLELYKAAYAEQDVRYIYLIEDDVHVAPDFFRWHEAVQERSDYFCTVGWDCMRNEDVVKTGTPEDIVESSVDFTSIGVCWKRDRLAAVVEHACPEYYRDIVAYMKKHFFDSPLTYSRWQEQAGLVLRILLAQKDLRTAWPVLRRVHHVGLNGYHRTQGASFAGSLNGRIDALRRAIKDGNISKLSKDPFDDLNDGVTPRYDWRPEDLRVVQRLEFSKANS